MGVTLQWSGMNEFKEALRKLPAHLTDEAADIVISSAESAGRTVQANYPTGPTGNLKRGVRVSQERGTVSTAGRVSSRAPHAFIFEKGTGNRRTKRGWGRGRMPAAPPDQAAIPVFVRTRARMLDRLIQMLEREGFEVSR